MPFDNLSYGFPDLSVPVIAPSVKDEVLDVLLKAREWLSDPAHWCKESLIQYADGCGDDRKRAASSCAWGALHIVDPNSGTSDKPAYRLLESLCGAGKLQFFNDDPKTTHADVLALFDRAIASRLSQQSVTK